MALTTNRTLELDKIDWSNLDLVAGVITDFRIEILFQAKTDWSKKAHQHMFAALGALEMASAHLKLAHLETQEGKLQNEVLM